MIATESAADANAMTDFSTRIEAALTPQAKLSELIAQGLSAPMPGKFLILLKQAKQLLKKAASFQNDLHNVSGDDNAKLVSYRAHLTTFRDDFLIPAQALCELALSAALLPHSQRQVSLLTEALNQLYYIWDTEFASIASWHKKTAWLVWLSLMLVLVLSAAFGNAALFVLGALGGLMSRLARVLVRPQLPTDYGFSWTTLFLSPIVGALAGWTGVLLLAIAVKHNVVGNFFASVAWTEPQSELVMGLAVVLGVSERLFVKIVEGVEGKAVLGGAADAKAAAETTSPAEPKTSKTPVNSKPAPVRKT